LNLSIINSRVENSFYNTIFNRNVLDESGNVSQEALSPQERQVFAFIQRDFLPRFATTFSYHLTINNDYATTHERSTTYFRMGFENGGLLGFLADWVGKQTGWGDGSVRDNLLNGRSLYGQFVKFTGEARHYKPLGNHAEFVTRAMGGIAIPLNFTNQIPLENRFFIGGVNSVRGWQSNTLGPGLIQQNLSAAIPIGGDVLLELNAELRRDLTGPLEMALFLDAGNVWVLSRSKLGSTEAQLSMNNFQLGVSGGIGLRMDLSFLIVRVDVAQQLYAPDVQRFIPRPFPQALGAGRLQYNIGIGYPF
jgi:outer membrane protein assembly factor BamA